MASYESAISAPMAPRAIVNTELAAALERLAEVSGQAGKAAEQYLVARDEWVHQRAALDEAQDAVSKLRSLHDATVAPGSVTIRNGVFGSIDAVDMGHATYTGQKVG